MAVTNYSAEYPGSRTDAEAAADPFDAEPFGRAIAEAATPPVVDNVIPASGSSLAPGDSVQFDLTHSSGASALEEIVVMIFSRAWEVAYDLDAASFGPAFGGTRVDITNGYRFTLYRREGWQFLPGSGLEIRVAPRTTDGATSS